MCQWCITYIKKSFQPIEDILDNKFDAIVREAHQRLSTGDLSEKNRPLPPASIDCDDLLHKAEHAVKKNEGFFSSVYRLLIGDEQRKKEISAKYKELYDSHQKKYDHYREKYENEISKFLQERDLYKKNINQLIRDRYIEWVNEILTSKSLDVKQVKLLRAYFYGLINGSDKIIERISVEEMRLIRESIIEEDNYSCTVCGKSIVGEERHIHHIIPLSKHGTNDPRNLATLCYKCHNDQHKTRKVTRSLPRKRKFTGGTFISVCVGTTGNSNKDQITRLSAIKFQKGMPKEKFHHLVTVCKRISDKPNIEYVFSKFVYFIDDHKLVFHDKRYGLRFIKNCANRFGYEIGNEVIDTFKISKKKLPHLRNHQLKTLIRYFGLNFGHRHRAYYDALALGFVYIKCSQVKKR